MDEDQVVKMFDNGELETQYADYIMSHATSERIICNGDTLTNAIEDLYLYEDFIASLVTVR